MFVTRVDEDIKTVDDSKANIPKVRSIYKIINLKKNNFCVELENVTNGDRLSTTWNNVKQNLIWTSTDIKL